MRRRSDAQAPRKTTRTRILEAAMLRFAQYSYEEARLRDIADDVGVDVALVHRTFGSKERLFTEVVEAAFEPHALFAAERDKLTARLTERMLEPSLDRTLRLIDPIDIIIRSLLSPAAIPILRAAVMRDIVAQVAPKLEDPSRQRAALLGACLAGIGIFRNVLRVKPMIEDADITLRPLIASIIDTLVNDTPAPRPSRPPKTARAGKNSSPARRRRSARVETEA